ncbi:hypothetical protein D3C72_2463800 [compost metagenome]
MATGLMATHSGRSMVVAPTLDAAWRVKTQISSIFMPVDSGVSATHSPVPSSENLATKSVPSSSSFEVSPPGT